MKNIVGKLLFFSVWSTLGLSADLVLEVTTPEDLVLKQAGVGQPFVIRVTETDSRGSITQPEIRGLDAFSQHGNSFSMHTINNTSTIVYKYTVRADELGTCTIGPAVIKDGTEITSSNSVDVVVGNETIVEKKYHRKQPQVFMRLETDKKDVVVGEEIHCTGTVYFSDQLQTRVQALHQPAELQDYFTVVQQEEVEQGEEEVDGYRYRYGRWKWNLYPKKSGALVIPAWSVDYSMLDSEPSFFSFMGFWENKRVYSNALDLDIHPLPAHDPPVTAIGLFSSYVATVEQHRIEQGSGSVLRLTLAGQGNWNFIPHPPLQGMPDGFRSYESTHSLERDTTGEKKSFEYIIHGVQAGEWEIPAQSFTFFDTRDKVYKTLTTVPLTITVTPSSVPVTLPPQPTDKSSQQSNDKVYPLKEAHHSVTPHWLIPWYLFLIACLIPFMVVCWRGCRVVFDWYRRRYELLIAKYSAFGHAKKKLHHAQETQDYHALYPLFVRLFASRAQVPVSHMSKAVIKTIVSSSVDAHTLEQWNLFCNKIEAVHFVHKEQDSKILFDAAQKWIALFEKKGITYDPSTDCDSSVASPPAHSS